MSKLNAFFDMAEEYLGPVSAGRKALLLMGYLVGRVTLRAGKKEFFQYGLYEKNFFGRNKYITGYRKLKFVKAVSNEADCVYFNDKVRFVERFAEFVARDTLDMKTATKEEFLQFVKVHPSVFVKPSRGYFGFGAGIETCANEAEAEQLFDRLTAKEIIVEEILQQCDEMAEFNDTSVNTLRVVTFVKADGTPILMPGAALRTGRKGKHADNFHHQGIGSLVDIDTGVVNVMGIDKNGTRYIFHPDSGKQLVGFHIPYWDKIAETVKKAALVVPSVRYVGWDVVIGKNGKIMLIEGNCYADPDLAQMGDGIGKWNTYKALMQEIQATKA